MRPPAICILAILPLAATGQFVFFGNHHGPARSLGAAAPAPARQPAAPAPREGRLLVQAQPQTPARPQMPQPVQPQRFPVRPSVTQGSSSGLGSRFAPTFFRPLTKLHHPGKNALPESDEPAKFVRIVGSDQILTERPPLTSEPEMVHMEEIKKMMEMLEMERQGRLVVIKESGRDTMPGVALPAFTPSSTTAPVVVTTMAPTMAPSMAPMAPSMAPTTISPPETTVVVKTMAPLSEVNRAMAAVTRPALTFFDATTAPTTQAPTTQAPTTQAPTTQAPTTQAPTTQASTTTEAITTTTMPAPTSTTKPMMRIVSSIRSSPFTLGTPTVTQLGGPAPRAPRVQAPAPTPRAPAPVPRAPKALAPARAQAPPRGNYQFDGRSYLLTWRMGRNNFDWRGGQRFCESQGMRIISLDTREETEHFLRLLTADRAPYFWSGGQVSRDSRTVSWPSGKTDPIARGQHPWSFTGRTGPQPDGGERCLAVLNNTYRDGVKFHDVACHHRKPVICEEV